MLLKSDFRCVLKIEIYQKQRENDFLNSTPVQARVQKLAILATWISGVGSLGELVKD